MEVLLPPDLQQFLTDQVNRGLFPSTSDAVCHAVATLREREGRRSELQRDLDVGLEQARRGEVKQLDVEAFKAEARQRLSQNQGN